MVLSANTVSLQKSVFISILREKHILENYNTPGLFFLRKNHTFCGFI